MSLHSYSKCWLHLIWGTLNREHYFVTGEQKEKVSEYLYNYAKEKNIYMKNNYVNAEHVHALIDLPTNYSIEEAMHLLKGNSSHWINEENLTKNKFSWSRGYAALSVSETSVEKVNLYISNQEEHHRAKSYIEEYREFIELYGMQYNKEV